MYLHIVAVDEIVTTHISFCSIPLHHWIKFINYLDQTKFVNSVSVQLEQKDMQEHLVLSWFDTVLVCDNLKAVASVVSFGDIIIVMDMYKVLCFPYH